MKRRTFQNDYSFGKEQEDKTVDTLSNYFKTELKQNEDRYAKFDFENDTLAIEQKARTCSSKTYDTTMLQYSKIKNCHLPEYLNKDKWFVFSFTDGLYGIKYDEAAFEKYDCATFRLQDRLGYKEREEPRIFIPISDLLPISI